MGFLPLVIDPAVKDQIREIIALAHERPIPLEVIQLLAAGEPMPQGLHDDFTLVIPMGFPVIYTHEVQPNGILRHMSMSVNLEGRVPHPEAVRMVMQEFGYVNDLEHCIFWEEAVGGGKVAINVVEPLDGDWTPHRK
jgi:hypothetical protein